MTWCEVVITAIIMLPICGVVTPLLIEAWGEAIDCRKNKRGRK